MRQVSRLMQVVAALAGMLCLAPAASGQYLDSFDEAPLTVDPRALNGWAFFSGDGTVTMDLAQQEGHATIAVDARSDTLNVWWALVKRAVSGSIDVERLSRPGYELRIEARVRTNAAPRRINLHANTGRTTDFHSHLMEYDLPDTVGWHTISMTTHGFDALPGDTVYAQLALMDWGLGAYRLDLDYFRVDVVDASTAGKDEGGPLPYHPALSDPEGFPIHLPATEYAMIDTSFAALNFAAWRAHGQEGAEEVVTVGGSQWTLLRWDLSAYAGRTARRSGMLALPTHALLRATHDLPELGQIRVVEIFGGDPTWSRESVTYRSFMRGERLADVFNPQMIIDVEVDSRPGGTTWATIPRPVLQRMIDGRTRGILLRPVGPIQASFFSGKTTKEAIRLLFEVE